MSKRILIIERCTDCPHYIHALTPDGLLEGHGCMFDGVEPNLFDSVPDNCPLVPVPDYQEVPDVVDNYYGGYAYGWNECLDEMEGGGENE